MPRLLAFVACLGLAAALPQAPTPVFHGTTASSGVPSATTAAMTYTGPVVLPSPTCVSGPSTRVQSWDIDYAAAGPPVGASAGSFVLQSGWADAHKIGSQNWDGLGADYYAYAEFKCQYSCNSMPGCLSFVGRSASRGFECVFFNALIDTSYFASSPKSAAGTVSHAYNKLCRVTKRETVLSGDAKWTRCNGEFCCTDDVACPITSDCAELGLIDVKPDEGWRSFYLDSAWVAKHRWAAFAQEGDLSSTSKQLMETQCKVACIKNSNKCASFFVGYGFPDPDNGYPGFLLSMGSRGQKQGFICNLFSKNIDKSMYRQSMKEGTWSHVRGVDIGCVSPLIK